MSLRWRFPSSPRTAFPRRAASRSWEEMHLCTSVRYSCCPGLGSNVASSCAQVVLWECCGRARIGEILDWMFILNPLNLVSSASHLLHLTRWDPEVFPRPLRDVVPSPQRPGGNRNRCPSHLSWFLSMWRSSGFTLSSSWGGPSSSPCS